VITITLGRLVNAVPVLKRISDLPLGMQACYDVSKLTKLVDAETKIFTERVAALRTQLGVERDTTEAERKLGAPATVHDVTDNLAAFQTALDELATVAVTIDWKPFDLTALCTRKPRTAKAEAEADDDNPFDLTPAEMNLLGVHDAWALAVPPKPAEMQGEKSI
jgi:hypothetical protein